MVGGPKHAAKEDLLQKLANPSSEQAEKQPSQLDVRFVWEAPGALESDRSFN